MQTKETLDWAIRYANAHSGQIVSLSGLTNGYPTTDRRSERTRFHGVLAGGTLVVDLSEVKDVRKSLFLISGPTGRVEAWYVAGWEFDSGNTFLREASPGGIADLPRSIVYSLSRRDHRSIPAIIYNMDVGTYYRIPADGE